MSKLEELKELRKNFDIQINGIENISQDNPNLFISNHNCLMDIFFLPMSLPSNIVSLISSRLIYKKEIERQRMVEKYLYAMPIEAHGGNKYSDMCINSASTLLSSNIDIGIFPEGAYVNENVVYRGRTGAARILYNSRKMGTVANFVPVAIDINKDNLELDSYNLEGTKVTISILNPIDYNEYYESYMSTSSKDEKNYMLHKPIDQGLEAIAKELNRKYVNEYIELYPKNNIILENGDVVPTLLAQSEYYTSLYASQLEERKIRIYKK